MSAGARGVLAAADQIHARIADAEKLRAALEEIRRLHADQPAAATPCDRCCATTHRPWVLSVLTSRWTGEPFADQFSHHVRGGKRVTFCECGHEPRYHHMDVGRCEAEDETLWGPAPCKCPTYERDTDE